MRRTGLGASVPSAWNSCPEVHRAQLVQRVAGVAQRGRVGGDDALRGGVEDQRGRRPLLEGGDVGLVVPSSMPGPAGRSRAATRRRRARTNRPASAPNTECQLVHTSSLQSQRSVAERPRRARTCRAAHSFAECAPCGLTQQERVLRLRPLRMSGRTRLARTAGACAAAKLSVHRRPRAPCSWTPIAGLRPAMTRSLAAPIRAQVPASRVLRCSAAAAPNARALHRAVDEMPIVQHLECAGPQPPALAAVPRAIQRHAWPVIDHMTAL